MQSTMQPKMKIELEFDTPTFPNHFLEKCGLGVYFDVKKKNSCISLRILSLFAGVSKQSKHLWNRFGVFKPSFLPSVIELYRRQTRLYEEWQLQLLVAMILHTCRFVSEVVIESHAERLLSRTGEATDMGRFDVLYTSNEKIYLIELKMLGSADFIEGDDEDEIESWLIKPSKHTAMLFGFRPDTVTTIGDALEWTTVQAASYKTGKEITLFTGILLVNDHCVLIRDRKKPVSLETDFTPSQWKKRKETKK